jgi:hypothetical protein
MKTEFQLDIPDNQTKGAIAKIIGERPSCKPYLMIIIEKKNSLFVKDRDLERFAVNILKALKSKKLKQ